MFLVADIGGTKIDIAAFTYAHGTLSLAKREIYATKDYPGVVAAFHAFEVKKISGLRAISIGLAAPVQSRSVKLTNLDWVIDADELQREFDCPHVYLMNDLAAHAYGAIYLADEHRFTLQQGQRRPGNMALLAPGTGLGEAHVFFDGTRYHPIPSEGGHTSFAPTNKVELELLDFVFTKHRHVSTERMMSGGMGFDNLAAFYLERKNLDKETRALMQSCFDDPHTGEMICRHADKGNKTCQEIMRIYVGMLGAEAGNMALQTLAIGGVILCGGIPTKILPWLKEPEFLAGFQNKGRFANLLAGIHVAVITDEMNALRGLAHFSLATIYGK